MDPAFMNYMQAQQQQEAQGQMQPMAQMPQAPQMQGGQQLPVPQMNMPQPQAPTNPFDSGIKRAIESARESLGMTQDQKDKAFQRGLFGFASRMSQEPVQSGFWNNFGAASRAIGSGMNEYNQAEDMALVQNNALANQMLQQQNLQRAQEAKAEEQAWKRNFAEDEQEWKRGYMENQLAEQQRYHDIIGNRPAGGARGALEVQDVSFLGETITPMEYRTELNQYDKSKKGLGAAKESVDHLLKVYNEYLKKHGDVRISPWGTIVNPLLDVKSRFSNDPKVKEERKDWDVLRSQLGSFNIGGEQQLRGGGAIGQGLIKYMDDKQIYPTLKNNPESALGILEELKRHINKNYTAANLSLKYHARIDPSQVDEVEKNLQALKDLGESPQALDELIPQATGAPSVPGANTPDPFAAAGITFD